MSRRLSLFGKKIWGHAQNLNDGGNKFWRGRCWLHFGEEGHNVLALEWSHGTKAHFCEISVTMWHFDDLIRFHIGIPWLFSWWITWQNNANYYDREREVSLSWHSGRFWWKVWTTVDSWTSETPKWKDGSWCPVNTLLGRPEYSEKTLSRGETEIVMPEGSYRAKYREHVAIWKRARWPWASRARKFDFEMIDQIPEPGKGENSWDLEDNALFGMSCVGDTLEEAKQKVIDSVTRTRKRYGGAEWRPEKTA